MHCVLLGVTKMLLQLWFDSKHSHGLWYCGDKIEEADSKLLQIKPPINITRVPRSIQNHRSYWKASECRSWLLFCSIPVMYDILPTEYLVHHMLLVEAIYILLSSSITPLMLDKAKRMINHYCFKIQSYYTEHQMTANVHHLLHLPETVLNFGPLHVYSCFVFEGLNGHLLNHIKGTQHVELQITEAIYKSQMLPQMAQSVLQPGGESISIYQQMTSKIKISDNTLFVGTDCIALGSVDKRTCLPNPIHHQALLCITKHKEFGIFKRALINQVTVIHSLSHSQPQKRNSYTVSYQHQGKFNHGEILYFVTDYSQAYAIISPFTNPLLLLPSDDITMCTIPHTYIQF